MEKEICFLPIKIKEDKEKGVKTIVWLEFYEEEYKYCGEYLGRTREHRYRLINK